jgi:hypothetical protein
MLATVDDAETPQPVLDRLNRELTQIVKSPGFAGRVEPLGGTQPTLDVRNQPLGFILARKWQSTSEMIESPGWFRRPDQIMTMPAGFDAAYYNRLRTHRSLNKDAPIHRAIQRVGPIGSAPVLGGLHHHYCRI